MVVDLRSDTVTRPDAAMREAIAKAEVGDDVLGDDTTTAELERYAADLLGKERALFFPSGIMANQTAIIAQSVPGSDVVVDAGAHILHYEEGAAAAWAGVQLRPVASHDGIPDGEEYGRAVARNSRYLPRCSLVCLENTHNVAGGRIVPVAAFAAVAAIVREAGASIHLDGARLPNASVATGRPMRDWADLADTVMVSLSKGLGAPIGSVLAGPASLMDEAWRIRRRLGGAMRQVGLLAAAGMYALRHNLEGLAHDHRRARDLAAALSKVTGLMASSPDTNIVMIDLDPDVGSARHLVDRLGSLDVLISEFGPQRVRVVTHRDVDDEGIRRAIEAFGDVISQ